MAASKTWASAAARVLVEELGRKEALRIVGKLERIRPQNMSIYTTLDRLHNSVSCYKEKK